MKQIELTSKLVVALIALVVFSAMTVPSVVAQSTTSPPIRANSVTSGSIKDGEVKTDDIANDAVTSGKIKNGEVKAEDLASGVIPPDDVGSLQTTIKQINDEQGGVGALTYRINCDAGQVVTGGGYFTGLKVFASFPEDSNTWTFGVNSNEGETLPLSLYAICAEVTQ